MAGGRGSISFSRRDVSCTHHAETGSKIQMGLKFMIYKCPLSVEAKKLELEADNLFQFMLLCCLYLGVILN